MRKLIIGLLLLLLLPPLAGNAVGIFFFAAALPDAKLSELFRLSLALSLGFILPGWITVAVLLIRRKAGHWTPDDTPHILSGTLHTKIYFLYILPLIGNAILITIRPEQEAVSGFLLLFGFIGAFLHWLYLSIMIGWISARKKHIKRLSFE